MSDSRSTVDPMSGVRTRPLRRAEYDLLIEQGAFEEDERIQLLDGELVVMSPQGIPHATVIERLTEVLVPALAGRARVRVQLPFAAGDLSEPEPDVAIVSLDVPRDRHPDAALLVIEVADRSLALDLGRKARIYSAAGVCEYWVIDTQAQVAHVHGTPTPRGYAQTDVRPADAPLDAVGVTLTVRQLLT